LNKVVFPTPSLPRRIDEIWLEIASIPFILMASVSKHNVHTKFNHAEFFTFMFPIFAFSSYATRSRSNMDANNPPSAIFLGKVETK